MKTLITLAALVLASNFAIAESFHYEAQIGNQDLDPNVGISDTTSTREVSSDVRISLQDWYQDNHDVMAVPYEHYGKEQSFEGDLFTSYDALNRSNPDLEA